MRDKHGKPVHVGSAWRLILRDLGLDELAILRRAGLLPTLLEGEGCSPDMNTAATRLGQFKRLVGPFSLDVDIDEVETRIRCRCKHRPDVPRTRGRPEKDRPGKVEVVA